MAERGDTFTDAQLSPARTKWMQWLLPCIGPPLAAASAGLQPSWASGRPARTPPGKEGTEVRRAAGACACNSSYPR